VTRRFAPDPAERTRWVDPLTERWINFWGLRHPAKSKLLTLANGDQVTATELRRIIEEIDGGRGGYQLAMLVGGRVAGMIGRDRMAVHDLSDGHFHHVGYDDPRNNGIGGFLRKLRDAGHQGVITFHPIPQRGMGLATLGGSFYYGIASVLTLGLLFKQPMLQMWGKFPDVRLLDAVRALPKELQWRAVVGVVGARMDVPGALGYLRTLARPRSRRRPLPIYWVTRRSARSTRTGPTSSSGSSRRSGCCARRCATARWSRPGWPGCLRSWPT
jgi:hypothetical protein